jgi:hypothetical protein
MHIIHLLLSNRINTVILRCLIEILQHFTFLRHLDALLKIFHIVLILEAH